MQRVSIQKALATRHKTGQQGLELSAVLCSLFIAALLTVHGQGGPGM